MKKRIQLSKNFYLDEFTRSETAVRLGIDNDIVPGCRIHRNVQRLVLGLLQPMRDELGPVHILSGYRSEKLNKKIGGAPHSAHIFALAADIVVSGYEPIEVAEWVSSNLFIYDQLILEFDQWCHIAIAAEGQQYRQHIYTAYKKPPTLFSKPKTKYLPGLFTAQQIRQRG